MLKTFHFIVGDIHGCLDELLELEEKAILRALEQGGECKIVSVGDLVDRGPYSNQVVDHFLKGKQNKTHLAVIGNHESFFLQYLYVAYSKWLKKKGIRVPRYFYTFSELYKNSTRAKGLPKSDFPSLIKSAWLSQGGYETLKSYRIDSKNPEIERLPVDHIKYLFSLPPYLEIQDFIVTHALPTRKEFHVLKKHFNKHPVSLQEVKKAFVKIQWNRSWEGVEKIGGKKLISGHTPDTEPRRNKSMNVLQIDTRCFRDGKLTAYCPELDEFIFVKAKKTYY